MSVLLTQYKKSVYFLYMKQSILALSRNEKQVFDALREGHNTPLVISNKISIPRPTVYVTLEALKARGLVERRKENGKHYWKLVDQKSIEEKLYEAKKYLFDFADGKEEVKSQGDSFVVIHRGKDAIIKMLHNMFKEHKNQKFHGIQGKKSSDSWESLMGVEGFNEYNQEIKKNNLIVHAITEEGWTRGAAEKYGKEWIQGFEGRTTSVHEIPSKYMNHATEVWLFKNAVYLLAPLEEIVIEIQNSELVRMMKSLFSFVEDHSEKVDVNRLLRGFLQERS